MASVRGCSSATDAELWEGGSNWNHHFLAAAPWAKNDYRLPEGMTIPRHKHLTWCQVFVVQGTMEVQVGNEPLQEDRPELRKVFRTLPLGGNP